MSINCSNNPKLEALNAKKKELADQAANLESQGAAAMADLTTKANAAKDSLLDMIPEIPAVPNFQAEIQALAGKVGQALIDAKAAFKKRWGDALPDVDIDDLMNKVSAPVAAVGSVISGVVGAVGDVVSGVAGAVEDKFDLCKDVPNVDAPEVVDGKVTKVKDKGPAPTTATEIPKVVEVVEPTVVEKEKQRSVNAAHTKAVLDIRAEIDAFDAELKETYQRYIDAILASNKLLAEYEQDPLWGQIKQAQANRIADFDKSYGSGIADIDYANSGAVEPDEYRFILKYYTEYYKVTSTKMVLSTLRNIHNFANTVGLDLVRPNGKNAFDEYTESKEKYINENYFELTEDKGRFKLLVYNVGGVGSVVYPFAGKFLANKEIMDDLYAVRNAADRNAAPSNV